MAKEMSQEEAGNYLRDVNPEVVFWASNGSVIKNLGELPEVIKSLSDEQFTHHVNEEKNDFRNWIVNIVGDKELAKAIAKLKTKSSMIKKISTRIRTLKRTAG